MSEFLNLKKPVCANQVFIFSLLFKSVIVAFLLGISYLFGLKVVGEFFASYLLIAPVMVGIAWLIFAVYHRGQEQLTA